MTMSIEPILAFILIRYLRKNLKTFSPDPNWNKLFTGFLYAIIALFVVEVAFHLSFILVWIWHVLLLAIVYVTFTVPKFERTRPVIIAVLPFIVLSIVSDILENFAHPFYLRVESIFEFAFVAAITLMVALLVRSSRQVKALEKERQKTLAEEEKRKFIAAQNEKLELVVAERTAEITMQKDELQHALHELKATQTQLIHSEKMASLGELTAGIAHEIQNPLNFVNNFSELNSELIEEMKTEIERGNLAALIEIADNIKENEEKIMHHGKRADGIVKGMLQHSRSSNGQKELTDINALADEYLRLSYHGLRAKDKSFNAMMETHFDESLQKIQVIPQDVGRAFLNLFTNAFYAVSEKKKHSGEEYKPTVTITTRKCKEGVEITVRDNGDGIPEKALDKIFQPFFTTKPSGEGTGLGLSLSYEIITQGHGGDIRADTKDGEFAEFTIKLPA